MSTCIAAESATVKLTKSDRRVRDAIERNLSADGTLRASRRTLAALAGVSVPQVSLSVKRLKAAGLLGIDHGYDPMLGSLPNVYSIPATLAA